MNPNNPYEHYDPEFEDRQRRAKQGLAGMGEFLKEQATDPTTYLGVGGAGMFGKALGKAAVGTWGLLSADNADAMVYGRPARAAVDLFEKLIADYGKQGLDAARARSEAFKATGVFKGADGKYRGYISDKGASFDRPQLSLTRSMTDNIPDFAGTPIAKLLKHDELYQKFPSLKGVPVKTMTEAELAKDRAVHGLFNRGTGVISVNPNLTEKELLDVLLHEIQHKVQQMTGTPGGGNMRTYMPEGMDKAMAIAEKVRDNISQQLAEKLGRDPLMVTAIIHRQPEAIKKLKAKYGEKTYHTLENQVMDYERLKNKLRMVRNEAFDKYQKLYGEAEARTTSKYKDRDLRETGLDPDQALHMDPGLKGGWPTW